MVRSVMCTDQSGQSVDPSLCPGIRPTTTQKCNAQFCTACSSAFTCLGRGSCTSDGSCACQWGFSGQYCQVSILSIKVHAADSNRRIWCLYDKHYVQVHPPTLPSL